MDIKVLKNKRVKCRITGMTGFVIAEIKYSNGSKKYKVKQEIKKDGDLPKTFLIDSNQLDVI